MRPATITTLAAILLSGCASSPPPLTSTGTGDYQQPPRARLHVAASHDQRTIPITGAAGIKQVTMQQPQPPALTLELLEQMAVENNPTRGQAQAQVQAAFGRAIQGGLCPNPRVGYQGEEMGVEGTAGQQGVFIDQLIVTADKLQLSRRTFSFEALEAQWQAVAQQYRVLNGVRVRFYQVLALQQIVKVSRELLQIAEGAVTTTEELLNVGQANRPDLLAARTEARRTRLELIRAENAYQAAWQELAAFVGTPQLPPTPLEGTLESELAELEWEPTRAHLFEASPELQVARARVSRNHAAVQRERVEPIPNIDLRLGTAYDYDSRDQIASAEIGLRLPIFDRNQGNIQTAEADLIRAQFEHRRVELSLERRLARAFARYRANRAAVEEYEALILPASREAYQLYLESFQRQRAAWPQVLVAQRTYFQSSVEYVQALLELRRAEVAILGLLLVDGLEEPPAPGESRDVREPGRAGGEEGLNEPIDAGLGRGPNQRFGG